MTVEYGTKEDISSWMKLVNLVSWNFPGLETEEKLREHKNTVLPIPLPFRNICPTHTSVHHLFLLLPHQEQYLTDVSFLISEESQ